MIRDTIARWTHGEPWRTWVAHAVIALIIALPLALLWDPAIGGAVAVGYYLIRELEQIVYALVDRKKLTPLDNVMDVAAPALVVLPFVWGVSMLQSWWDGP